MADKNVIQRAECPTCGEPSTGLGGLHQKAECRAAGERSVLRTYVAVDVLLSDEAVKAADDTIEAWAADGTEAIANTRLAIQAAVDAVTGEQHDA